MPAPVRPLAERLWEKVIVGAPDECWPFTGAKKDGYGVIGLGGRKDGITKAHRVAFFVTHGRWPEPVGRHTCDNPPCCNPAHILEGTHKDNARDRMSRDRPPVGVRGERNNRAKLTDAQVEEMRALHASGIGYRRLSQRFGIDRAAVRYRVTGKGSYRDQVAARERAATGQRYSNAKLSAEQVLAIRQSDASTAELALKYGMSWPAMNDVRTGKTYRKVGR